MAQHDYTLSDQSFPAMRADLNNVLAAIASQNSGNAGPSTTYAYQLWADTTTGLLKIRNAANNAWITIGTLGSANLGLATAAALAEAQTFTQSGPGAVNRSVTSKQREVVSVQDYGGIADCTGQGVGTDVIPAIKRAVDYVVSVGSGGAVVLPPGRYRASTAAVLDLGGKHNITIDLQGDITPDGTAMTVLTIQNGESVTLNASIFQGGIFNGWAAAQPYGPCNYSTTQNPAANGGQEMFLIRGVSDYTVNIEATNYAGRVLRTDERASTSHPPTQAIKGQIKTRRSAVDFNLARTAQSLWAQAGAASYNAGNWGALDTLICDYDYWGPVWSRLNDIFIGYMDTAFALAGPAFKGCISIKGDTWYIGDTDDGAGSRHLQFLPESVLGCEQINIGFLKFLNKGQGLYCDSARDINIDEVYSVGASSSFGDVVTLINCVGGEIGITGEGNGSSLCKISGPLTGAITIDARNKFATFTDDAISIASDVSGTVLIRTPRVTNQTANKSIIKVASTGLVMVQDPVLSGSAGNIFDLVEGNNVQVTGGNVNTANITLYRNGIAAALVMSVAGLPTQQVAPFNYRANVGGAFADEGGAYEFGIAAAGYGNFAPMSRVKGQLVTSAGSELQGNLALQIRQSGSAGQSLINAITAAATSTEGEVTAMMLARLSGSYVSKRLKVGPTGSGPGGSGRALYVEN